MALNTAAWLSIGSKIVDVVTSKKRKDQAAELERLREENQFMSEQLDAIYIAAKSASDTVGYTQRNHACGREMYTIINICNRRKV